MKNEHAPNATTADASPLSRVDDGDTLIGTLRFIFANWLIRRVVLPIMPRSTAKTVFAYGVTIYLEYVMQGPPKGFVIREDVLDSAHPGQRLRVEDFAQWFGKHVPIEALAIAYDNSLTNREKRNKIAVLAIKHSEKSD